MGKLISTMLVVGAVAASAPAMAVQRDDDQRETARKACAQNERCREPRRIAPWYYQGHDEESQTRRRGVRRLSAEF